MAANPVARIAELSLISNHKASTNNLEIENPKPRLKDRLQSWLHSVFEGHHEFLGMTPD